MTEDIIQFHLIFKGHVQRIGFRSIAAMLANEMGLKGTVANLPDGTVEVYVQGESQTIFQFIENLKNHFNEKIHQVIIDENVNIETPYTHFNII